MFFLSPADAIMDLFRRQIDDTSALSPFNIQSVADETEMLMKLQSAINLTNFCFRSGAGKESGRGR